ncbi:MAG: amino acid permease [Rickettsiales bacterium]|nr:amino acid permease [Rickettsiales bacterium]
MFSNCFVRKSVQTIQFESQHGELKRSLSATNLVSLGIGCIIGTGIFVMTGQAAAKFAGPAVILSFMLAGLCCAFAAMCYAELSSMLPVSGSAYSYAYASLGEFAAWFIGWLMLLEYGIAGSTVAVGWSGYLVSFLKDFGIIIPPQLAAATGSNIILADGTPGTALFNLPAFLGLSVVTSLLVMGVKESVTINNIIVFIKVAVILLFIGVGFMYINPDNWHPFLPENTGEYGHFGFSGVLRGAGYIFFAYVGFEAVSTAAQEARNPQRDVPIGIIGSLVVCTILYMLVSLVLTGIVKYDTLNVPDPIAVAVDAIGLPWLAFLVKVGAIAGLSSVMLVLMYGQTRIFYTMAKDGLLPPVFSHVHPKFQTPWLNTIFVGAISGLVAGFTPIEALGDLVNLGTLMAFSIICFTVLYMRKREPELHRPFRLTYPRFVPIAGMLCCLGLISTLWQTFVMLIPYFTLGFVIYFTYGYRHSKARSALGATA